VRSLLDGWYAPYGSADAPDVRVTLTALPTGSLDGPIPITIRSEACVDGHRYRVRRYDVDGLIDTEAGEASFRHADTRQAFDTLLRSTLSVLLPRRGAALIHAAALGRGGRAFLFPGPSGAGKSTLTRVSGGEPVLTDELAVVGHDGRGFQVYGAPFHGDMEIQPKSDQMPLAAIVFPDRTLPRGVHELRQAERLARLVGTFICYTPEDSALTERLMDLASALASEVPALAVSLGPDQSVWDALPEGFAS